MREEDIEKFAESVDKAFKSKDPKFRNPSTTRVLLDARAKLNEERKKSPDVVSYEELLQWAIALEATHVITYRKISEEKKGQSDSRGYEFDYRDFTAMTNRSRDVQLLIEGIMNRPISEEQLSLLIAVSPGRDCSTENTPFFKHYEGVWYGDKDYIGRLITDEEKSQKFIKAIGKIPNDPFDSDAKMALLKMQVKEGYFLDNDADKKVCDKGLATILDQETKTVKEDSFNRLHAEKMLEELSRLNRLGIRSSITKIFEQSPNAVQAYQKLQNACVDSYRAKLEKFSPIKGFSLTKNRTSERNR